MTYSYRFLYIYYNYGDYYTDEDKTLHTNKFEALLLHEVLHALHSIIGIEVARNYYMPDGEEYYHDQGEFRAFVDTMDYYVKHYPEMDFDELLNVVSLSHSNLSRKTMERAHEVAVSRKPPLQYQLQPKADRINWYKKALSSQRDVGYHATSHKNAMSILREGFDGSISPEYFEEHYYSFLADLSPENQEKVENITPENWTGRKWDSACELLAELWFEEHPDTVVVWVSPYPDDIFGDAILEVDLSDMERFLDDFTYGLAYKYQLRGGEQRIPPRYFSLYKEEEGNELV